MCSVGCAVHVAVHRDFVARDETAAETAQMGGLVQQVDFPNFVAGLVHGVFEAVVAGSIEQTHAYGELVKASPEDVLAPDRAASVYDPDD